MRLIETVDDSPRAVINRRYKELVSKLNLSAGDDLPTSIMLDGDKFTRDQQRVYSNNNNTVTVYYSHDKRDYNDTFNVVVYRLKDKLIPIEANFHLRLVYVPSVNKKFKFNVAVSNKLAKGLKLTDADFEGGVKITGAELLDTIKTAVNYPNPSLVIISKLLRDHQKELKPHGKELEKLLITATLKVLKFILTRDYRATKGIELSKWINQLRHLGYDYPELKTVEEKLHNYAVQHLKHGLRMYR